MRAIEKALEEYEKDPLIHYFQRTIAIAENTLYSHLLGEQNVPYTIGGISYDFEKNELMFLATKDPEVIADWRNRVGEYMAGYTRSAYPEF